MAARRAVSQAPLFILVATTMLCSRMVSSSMAPCPSFSHVFAFGDSLTDTGNVFGGAARRLPYGETFFRRPTGRFSDGRLMIDHLLQALRLPLLPPHLASSFDRSRQNYAVAGATALDGATVQPLAGVQPSTYDSLGVQLGWFRADTSGIELRNALVYFGEIGGNDYNYALAGNRAPDYVASVIAPPAIQRVSDSLEQILRSGVEHVVVQGQFPMGCLPIYLTRYSHMRHDSHGCVAAVTAISEQHDRLLKQAVRTASNSHPNATIVFFDTKAAYLHILSNAASYGFTNTRGACYAGGLGFLTGNGNGAACSNPQNYISWDGIHLTDAMYGALMNLFLQNSRFTSPSSNFTNRGGCTS